MNKKKRPILSIVFLYIVVFFVFVIVGRACSDNSVEPQNKDKISTNDYVDTSDNTEKSTEPPETELPVTDELENSIVLVAGEKGEYGEMITYNEGTEFEESFYAYYIPAGEYEVTNLGEYPTQINVYSDETTFTEGGWEEPASGTAKLVMVGSTVVIEVGEGEHIEIIEPTKIKLTNN